MDVTMHNPERVSCQTLFVEYSCRPHGYVAYVDFQDEIGGTLTMHFQSPDKLREHAAALSLLAESLEEKQGAQS